jgi:hypothetical protein
MLKIIITSHKNETNSSILNWPALTLSYSAILAENLAEGRIIAERLVNNSALQSHCCKSDT